MDGMEKPAADGDGPLARPGLSVTGNRRETDGSPLTRSVHPRLRGQGERADAKATPGWQRDRGAMCSCKGWSVRDAAP